MDNTVSANIVRQKRRTKGFAPFHMENGPMQAIRLESSFNFIVMQGCAIADIESGGFS
ncbi:hypothetical protein GCM10025857_24960 [Alicyclobacillus contaminans]|nr:hypothetical protein GCM10025857_24960 [Alicyclobacillus contaminans]